MLGVGPARLRERISGGLGVVRVPGARSVHMHQSCMLQRSPQDGGDRGPRHPVVLRLAPVPSRRAGR
eukprot:5826857-Pleurochrysis_carterae.AAC.1